MNPAGDIKNDAQRHSGCFGSLFSRKPAAVTHFADIISETPDVNEIQQWRKQSVARLVTNDHEKTPVEVPEKIKQLAENTEACTSENNWPKAINKGQSQGSATNSDEALPNPEQEIEVNNLLMENDKQPILRKWTEILEKPDPEANTQPITNHQRENLSRDKAEEDVTDKGNEEAKSNSESSAENEKLRKRVQKLEENLAEFQEQLKQLQFEKNQLCNKATSQTVALESVQPESEQNHNAPAIAETSPEFMLDPTCHPALTDCQPTFSPVNNQQPDVNEEPIEEQKIAPNNEISNLTSDQNIHQSKDMAKTKAAKTGAAAKRGRSRPSKPVDNTDDSDALKSKKLKIAETVVEENGQEAKAEASDVEKTEPAAAKKGRGRPKRAEPEAEPSATEAKVEEPSSPVKKGRRRSKAPAKAVNRGANKTKKARGRPKKANSSEKSWWDTASDDNDDGEPA